MIAELVEFEFPKIGLDFTEVPKKASKFLPDTSGILQITLNSSKGHRKNSSNLRKVGQEELIALKKSIFEMSHV